MRDQSIKPEPSKQYFVNTCDCIRYYKYSIHYEEFRSIICPLSEEDLLVSLESNSKSVNIYLVNHDYKQTYPNATTNLVLKFPPPTMVMILLSLTTIIRRPGDADPLASEYYSQLPKLSFLQLYFFMWALPVNGPKVIL